MEKPKAAFDSRFYRRFGFTWRNPFITASKILWRGRHPQRVLGIWDFENGRAAIGDAIFFHAILLTIAERNRLAKIDCCFVSPARRNLSKNPYQVTDPTAVRQIIDLSRINPRLGSLFVFDDNHQFADFFHDRQNRYVIFPNPVLPFATVSNNHHLTDFFARHGYLPRLSCDEPHLQWARGFMAEQAPGRIPVCAAIRKNARDADRNAPVEPWRLFFAHCARRRPEAVFFVIGTEQEIHPELLGLSNVVFAKQHRTTLLQDIALIQCSSGMVAHASGPCSFAYFIDHVPLVTVGMDPQHMHFGTVLPPGGIYNFAAEHHRALWGPYTAQDLIRTFEELIVPRWSAPRVP